MTPGDALLGDIRAYDNLVSGGMLNEPDTTCVKEVAFAYSPCLSLLPFTAIVFVNRDTIAGFTGFAESVKSFQGGAAHVQ